MRYRFITVDVFTDRAFGGNPLAVVLDGRGLDTGQMQALTREFNLSETVFVLPPDDPAHTCRLRIFTPGAELPFAGHPTVGTAFVLATTGRIPLAEDYTHIIFEEGVGPVRVAIVEDLGEPKLVQFAAPLMPEFGPAPPSRAEVAAVIGLTAADLVSGDQPIEAVSCGVPFLYIEVEDRAALGRAAINLTAWRDVLADTWAPNLYVVTRDHELPNTDIRARAFVPAMGVMEDPATGAAATALAGFLAKREGNPTGTHRWVVEQGFEMGRPSIIEVEAVEEDGQVTAIRVGGRSVLISEGEIEAPPATAGGG
jgi:trans-2,3-dihydro-3-hydroxyanthranilate isomerase